MELPVEVYRKAGDLVTYLRVASAGAIVGDLAVASEEETHSWRRAFAFAGVAILDKVDGLLVRLHKDGPNPEGAQRDIESDEIITYTTESTLAIKDRDPVTGLSVLVAMSRDALVRKRREELRERSLDAKARNLGKYKTGWMNFTTFLQLSPVGEKLPKIIKTMRAGEMVLTLVSGFDIIRSANHAISEQDFQIQRSKTD